MKTADPLPQPPKRPPRASAFLVGAGILLSRMAGLLRESVFAHYFGISPTADAFKAALRIPNFLQNLFGEGVLSASFIPVYSRLLEEGETKLAGRVAGIVASVIALAVSVVVLCGVLLTPLLVDVIAPGFVGPGRLLTIHLVQIMFPGVGILVLSAWCLGILNSHRLFFISYVAPVLWNAAMIGSMVGFGGLLRSQDSLAVILAWGSVAGAALQLGIQLPFIFLRKGRDGHSIGADISLGLDLALAPVRQVFKSLGPVVLSRGVVQMSAFVDTIIASKLGSGAVASLLSAQTIYLLPISLFGMSVAAAELPEMSRSTGSREEINAKLRGRLVAGKQNIAFYVVPTVVGFLLLGRYIVAALFQSGNFGRQDTLYVWYILMGSTVGLLAATWGRLYSSAFYALRDTRTPLYFAIARVVLTAGLGLLFAFPLRPWLSGLLVHVLHLPLPVRADIGLGMGNVGLTASAGMSGWIEFLLLRRALQARIGSTSLPRFSTLKIWAASALAGAGGWSAGHFVPIGNRWASLGLVLAVFGALYAGMTLLLRVPQAQALLLRRRA